MKPEASAYTSPNMLLAARYARPNPPDGRVRQQQDRYTPPPQYFPNGLG